MDLVLGRAVQHMFQLWAERQPDTAMSCPRSRKHKTPIDNCRRKDKYLNAFIRSIIIFIINNLLVMAPA